MGVNFMKKLAITGHKILPAQMHTQTIFACSVKDLSLDFLPVRRGEAPYPRWVPCQLSQHFPITAILC